MSNERISPTAWLVAYERSLSNIPLASEVFHELDAIVRETRAAADVAGVDALKVPLSAAVWEARYKLVNQLLAAHPVTQVLELAAGFSPRGLNLAGDPLVTYVEMDLPGVIQDKQRIVDALVAHGAVPARPNFHLAVGDALSLPDLRAAAGHFADRPLAVVNEGLLHYLDRAQRAAVAGHVRALLERFGGVWITPDIDLQLPQGTDFGSAAGAVKDRAAQVVALTGVDMLKNRFENEGAARAFFEGLGFQVEQHSFTEVADQLVLPLDEPLARMAVERGVAFVMSLKSKP
jgi:O-methyltransferase involved in polyketide biosynthesis